MLFDNWKLQHHIRDRSDLTLSEKAVAFILSTYRNGTTGHCYPSQINLAKQAGISRQHINAIIKSLKQKRVIKVENSKLQNVRKRKVSNYVFLFDKM